MSSNNWFETSKKGLAKQAKERGAAKVFLELVSNALDERDAGATDINLQISPVAGRPLANIIVEDNSPAGFRDLSHAFTIFAESYKRDNPLLRGRFNLGEKLFLSLCHSATLETTTGTVFFGADGRKEYPRRKRATGTRIEAELDITRDELSELNALLKSLLLPADIHVTYNAQPIEVRKPVKEFQTDLPTLVPDNEGILRPTIRNTMIRIYEVADSELPQLYELGIPVVETLMRWHVSIGQKVPLNRDRDNVTPAYLRKVCTAVAEAMQVELSEEDATTWGNIVLADPSASSQLITTLCEKRFGELRASRDLRDKEANMAVTATGGTIVHGPMLSKEQWSNVRRAGAIMPSGIVRPTPKPYSDDPSADPAEILSERELSSGMRSVRDYAVWLGKELLGVGVCVSFVRDFNGLACYSKRGDSKGVLDFNIRALGCQWFKSIDVHTDELLIHELAHHMASNHLSHEYHEACCMLGAKLKKLALNKPEEFIKYGCAYATAEAVY